jgi:hypothetical protein
MAKKTVINGEEYEIEDEVHPVAEHFKQPIAEIELAKKLARYHEVMTELAALEGVRDGLRAELLEAGRGEKSVTAGDYAAFFQKVSGRVSTDWKQAYRDSVGEMPSEDVTKYVKRGEDSVRVEVRKLR